MEKTKRNIAVLCVSMFCIIVITFLAMFLKNINMRHSRRNEAMGSKT